MKKLGIIVCSIAAMMMTSCAMVSTGVGAGAFYTGVTEGAAVTANPLGTKVGQSSACNVLGIVATGDASINSAAKAAGIKKVSHVDVKKTSVLGIFASYTTVVYGN